MDETYRMLGREHEADLERDALKWRLAQEARSGASPDCRRQRSPSSSRFELIVRALRRIGIAATRG